MINETQDPLDVKNKIIDLATAAGFDAVGFARGDQSSRDRAALQKFLSAGYHASMDWMDRSDGRRGNPQALMPEVKAVIAVGLNYGPALDPMRLLGQPDRGAVSVYAQGKDYHDVVKKKLKQVARAIATEWGGDVKVFVDTAPVMEKPIAARAGIGWQGKHTNLVSRAHGSWLFLGEIFTDLDLPPDTPETDHCGSCDKCLRACPTDAFPNAYELDARKCISYLTIEHKGRIDDALMDAMGNRIYGCDDCLAVCPWTKFSRMSAEPALQPRAELMAPRLAELAQLNDAAFRDVFKGSPIKRTGRDRFVRNVLIAIGNSGDKTLKPVAEDLVGDASSLVADAARRAVAKLA